MIERQFVMQKFKEHQIQEFVADNLKGVGYSHARMIKTPLGEKIIIYASRPGLIVGRKGQNIKKLTKTLKKKFGLENPQIEINEIEELNLDPQIVAERISNSLERFGTSKFKGIGHKIITDVLNAGALGIEVIISGKIPSSRAKKWRFYQGYLKKCGDIATNKVGVAYSTAELKTGTVGIQVRIMPSDIELPDKVRIIKQEEKNELEKVNEPKKNLLKKNENIEVKNTEVSAEKVDSEEKKPKRQKKKKTGESSNEEKGN